MLHFAPRARAGTALFESREEARVLWDALASRTRVALLVLMPDHVHAFVQTKSDVSALRVGMAAYAQWRSRRRGERGPVWRHAETTKEIVGRGHLWRSQRYAYLNPCRSGPADDPLTWTFSTYRDALGLAFPPLHRPASDAASLHARVSADGTTRVEGSALPAARSEAMRRDTAGVAAVLAAVSALTRTPVSWIGRPGPARRLLARALRELTRASFTELGARLALSASVIRAAWSQPVPGVDAVRRVLRDPRFAALQAEGLTRLPSWRRYLGRPSAQPGWRAPRPRR